MADTALPVRRWLDERAASNDFSGVVLVWTGGERRFAHAAGTASRRHRVPVTVDTRFHVGSVTKMTTATAALRLVEQGLVRLDQPLIELLPPERRPVATTPQHTFHHLLSHTSGFANYHDPDDPTFDSFIGCWDRVPVAKARRPADLLPLFVDREPVAPPGTELNYGDVNFVLIGLVVEEVTRRRFGDVGAEAVLDPAGMADSGFVDLDLDPVGLATGYHVTETASDEVGGGGGARRHADGRSISPT